MTPVGVTVNGAERTVAPGTTVAQLLADLGLPDRGIAVAVDGALLPKLNWSDEVERGAAIDVVTAVQGG